MSPNLFWRKKRREGEWVVERGKNQRKVLDFWLVRWQCPFTKVKQTERVQVFRM